MAEPIESGRESVTGELHAPWKTDSADFTALWLALLSSTLGVRAASLAYPLLTLATTHSPSDAGLVGFAALLPSLLFQIPAGSLVDRFNRRRLMLTLDAVRVVLMALFAAAVATQNVPLVAIIGVAFADNASLTIYRVAETAAIPFLVVAEDLPNSLARNEARVRAGFLAGQPLGAFLFAAARALPFAASAVLQVVSFGLVSRIRSPMSGGAEPERISAADALRGFGWLWRQPALRDSALLVAASNIVVQALILAIIVVVKDDTGSSAAVGLVLASGGAGGISGALIAPYVRRRLSFRGVTVGSCWAWAVALALMAVAPTPLALALLFAVFSAIGPIWNVTVTTLQLSATPQALFGRVVSAEMFLSYGVLPLGSLFGGYALALAGGRATIAGLGGAMVLIAVSGSASPGLRSIATGHRRSPATQSS
jgi:predicted MFS family arabinose efflux permease